MYISFTNDGNRYKYKCTSELSQSLVLMQKVGKYLVIEADRNVIVMRTLNDSKSAFVSVELNEYFFEKCETCPNSPFSCRVNLKAVCSIFKNNMKSMKSITIHTVFYDDGENELVFEICMQNGLLKTHRFTFSDCDIMSAIFNEEESSHLKCDPKLFAQLLDHFQPFPEIIIETARNHFQVKSFHQEIDTVNNSAVANGTNQKHMTTGLVLSINEFQEFHYIENGLGNDSVEQDNFEELVVCTKELKAMLSYCESTNTPNFYMFFSVGGLPIKLRCGPDNEGSDNTTPIRVGMVLATRETRRQAQRNRNNTSTQQRSLSPREENGRTVMSSSAWNAQSERSQPVTNVGSSQMMPNQNASGNAENSSTVAAGAPQRKRRLVENSDSDEA